MIITIASAVSWSERDKHEAQRAHEALAHRVDTLEKIVEDTRTSLRDFVLQHMDDK